MKFFLLVSLFLVASCAQVTSLNLKKHEFGQQPSRIIWFQIAGLEEEHLSMLRFAQNNNGATSFEYALCIGKTWDYSLGNLRNSAPVEFMNQVIGKKSAKNSCEDTESRAVWNYLANSGYRTGILEIKPEGKESLLSLVPCQKGPDFLKSLHMWIMNKPPAGASTFHYVEPITVKEDIVSYDRTCQDKGCFASIANNYSAVYGSFQRNSSKHIFIVRDFSYLKALKSKNFVLAREILRDLEKTLAIAYENASKQGDLILVSTAETMMIDFPDQGLAWYDFEKDGSKATVKRQKLVNSVFAFGARSENFCGVYEGASLLERMFSGPKQQGLEFKFINPFKD
jgi:Rieske Fe-S protein